MVLNSGRGEHLAELLGGAWAARRIRAQRPEVCESRPRPPLIQS